MGTAEDKVLKSDWQAFHAGSETHYLQRVWGWNRQKDAFDYYGSALHLLLQVGRVKVDLGDRQQWNDARFLLPRLQSLFHLQQVCEKSRHCTGKIQAPRFLGLPVLFGGPSTQSHG